jgi:GT2 family glycosyltransferase
MKVIVVIVSYNPLQWIEKCLDSLKSSSFLIETIVVDNNSSDGSQEIIKKYYPEVKLILSNENLGFGRANNIGIKKAYESGADYVFLLNQDAWIEFDTIKKLIEGHKKKPQYGILSPVHLNGKGDALDYNFSLYVNPLKCKNLYSDIYLKNYEESIYEVEFVNAAAWLISRECIERVGGFNPSFFHYGEDNNYIQRANYYKLKVGVLPNCNIYHDRENRKVNFKFKDELLLFKRIIILKVSNPFSNYSFIDVYKKLIEELIMSILFLRFGIIKRTISKIFLLNRINKKFIMENKRKTMTEKTVFLN